MMLYKQDYYFDSHYYYYSNGALNQLSVNAKNRLWTT